MNKLLWQPSAERIAQTNMFRFLNIVNKKYEQAISTYPELYHWSVNNIPDFWATFWDFAGIKASVPYREVVDDLKKNARRQVV